MLEEVQLALANFLIFFSSNAMLMAANAHWKIDWKLMGDEKI